MKISKSHYPIFLVLLFAMSPLPGCATLGLDSPFEGEAASEQEEAVDEVAEIARRYRRDSREQADHSSAQDQRRVIAQATGALTLGLSMDDVYSMWGEPREVIPAGAPGMGYEKWVYYEGLSSPWSVSTARVIYFEKGEVVGWQTARP